MASAAMPVDVGWNRINVKVTAQDGTSTQTYTIIVSRAATNTLVSNMGQHGGDYDLTDKVSNAFTTGSNAAGYTLASIGVVLDVSATTETYDLDLFSGSSGDPGTKLADLTAPTSLTIGIGPVYFTAPSNTALTASTTYHVVLSGSSGTGYYVANTDNEDTGSAAGWSIANLYKVFNEDNSEWEDDDFGESLSFQVRGAAAATQSTDATLSALTGSTSTDGSSFAGTLTLDPAFAAATEDYIATVPNNVTHIKVTPTRNHASATIEAGKGSTLATVTSGSASTAIALDVGANEINVKVTAQDGTTTKTYTIVVTRATATTLVSNVGQPKISGAYSIATENANAFTTGSNAAGYTLTGIDYYVTKSRQA